MAPIVKRDLAYTISRQLLNGGQKLGTLRQVGIGWSQNSPEPAATADPTPDIEQVSFYAMHARFIEAGFHDPCSPGKSGKIAPLKPGPAGGARHQIGRAHV